MFWIIIYLGADIINLTIGTIIKNDYVIKYYKILQAYNIMTLKKKLYLHCNLRAIIVS